MIFVVVVALALILLLGNLFAKTGEKETIACSVVVPAFLAVAALPVIPYWKLARKIIDSASGPEKFAIGALSLLLALISTLFAKNACRYFNEKLNRKRDDG